jgi:hypothetical protein
MKLPSKDQGRRIHTNRGYREEDEETELIDVPLNQELEGDLRGSNVDDCVLYYQPIILGGWEGGEGGEGGVAGI